VNFKLVLKAYSILRQLADDESALLDTLRTLTDTDRDLLVESLGPVKSATKKSTKKPAATREYDHCLRCGTTKRNSSHKDQASPDYHQFQSSQGKSARAVSLAEQIKGATGKPHLGDGPVCGVCSHTEDYADHLQPSPHYHEFQPPRQQAAAADAATGTDDIS
jgi:hypothetical protein